MPIIYTITFERGVGFTLSTLDPLLVNQILGINLRCPAETHVETAPSFI